MKVIAIILSGLVLQTSASFFEEFRDAVSSVESSFEKLLSDVITDVRENIDCTLLAVEQVLSLGMFGDSTEYERRCREGTEVVEEPVVVFETEPTPATPPPVQDTSHYITIPLTKQEHRQIDSSILDVDQVLCGVLKKDDAHAQLENVKLALKNETARLTEISKLLRKQLKELSAEVKDKFKAIELQTSEPSVESIWSDIKLLHEIEHKHKNTDEAKKISHLLDQILSILGPNEEDRSIADDYKIKEIMRKLSTHSKGGDSDLWRDVNDYPKNFRDYAKKVFDENRATDTNKNPESAGENKKAVNVIKNKGDKKDDVDKKNNVDKLDGIEKIENPKEAKPKRKRKRTTTTTEKPLTVEELAAEYGSLFDVMPDIDSIETKKAAEIAKSIIEDTKLNDEVMNSLAEMGANKEARNLFDDPIYLAI